MIIHEIIILNMGLTVEINGLVSLKKSNGVIIRFLRATGYTLPAVPAVLEPSLPGLLIPSWRKSIGFDSSDPCMMRFQAHDSHWWILWGAQFFKPTCVGMICCTDRHICWSKTIAPPHLGIYQTVRPRSLSFPAKAAGVLVKFDLLSRAWMCIPLGM